ncbi:MAG TPA: class I SAM-dependent methyltransferase [Elusimicrobiota bacterium]|nr:class I SAM-dependent methyltransferase [Elusimicrobiota bacterium]
MPHNPAQDLEAWDRSWRAGLSGKALKDGWYLMDLLKFERLSTVIPPTGKTLEVGCGTGRLSSLLALKGYDNFLLDYSRSALLSSRQTFEDLRLTDSAKIVQADAYRLPFDDNQFDIVMSTGLLEHFKDPSPIVREMTRVLVPGGLFYSDVVPKKFSLFRLSALWQPFQIGGESIFEGRYSPADIHAWLTATGQLENIQTIGAGVLPPYRLTHRPALSRKITFALKPLWRFLEGGWTGRALGCYYFVTAWKKTP